MKKAPVRVPAKREPKRKASKSGVDAELVRDLAKVLDDTGLTEIEVEYGELRLRLARTLTMAPPPPAHTHVVHSAPAPAAVALRRNAKAWLNLNIALAVLVVCLSGVLRTADKVPKAGGPAAPVAGPAEERAKP